MKKTFYAICLLAFAISALAQEEYITKSASGSTAATVYFSPRLQAASLVVADVTSDKAASVLSWKTATNLLTILAPVAADVTNMFTTVGSIVSNTAIVLVSSAGVVTPQNGFTNSFITNSIVYLENPIGSNVAVGSIAKELTGTFLSILSTSSTNVVSIVSNLNVITVGTNFLFQRELNQNETNQVKSWITNGANFDITLSNNFSFVPFKALIMTNTYNVTFAAAAADASIIFSNATSLVAADNIVILPTTGGAVLRQIQSTNSYRYQSTNIKAVTGVTLAAGDRIFVLDTAITTPVGATTVRLFADPIRVLPANMPGVLSVDGTSAVTINAAVLRYK
jgi:hypothetical protein